MDETTAQAITDEVRRGWTSEATGWVRHAGLIATLAEAATALVVRGADAKPGDRVLDVASGPGTVAFALAPIVGARGRVVATDLVDAMVAGAQQIARERRITNVEARQADAQALPFPDGSFDAVTCLHGVMFFPRPEKALSEFRRVLRRAGRASVLAWGPPEGNPFLTTVSGPFLRRMAPSPPDPDEPGPFRFAAPGKLAKVLEAAGFDDVHQAAHEIPWDFPGTPSTFWTAVQEISSSLFGWFRADLTPAQFADAAAEVQAAVAQRFDGEKVRFTATMVLATGRRT